MISSVASFFGFGDDEDKDVSVSSKKETQTSSIQKLETQVKTAPVQSSNSMIHQSRQNSVSKVVNNEPTYNINVSNPSSNIDVVKAVKEYELNKKNRQYEDID